MRSLRMDVGASIAASIAMLLGTVVGGRLQTATTTSASADAAPAAGRSCSERPLVSPAGPGSVGIARLCLTVDDVETVVELDGLTGGTLYTAWLGYQERPVGGASGSCASAEIERATPSQVDAAPAPQDGRLRLARTLPGLRPPSNTVLDVFVVNHGPAFAIGSAARSRQLLVWDRGWAGQPGLALDRADDDTAELTLASDQRGVVGCWRVADSYFCPPGASSWSPPPRCCKPPPA